MKPLYSLEIEIVWSTYIKDQLIFIKVPIQMNKMGGKILH